MTPPIIPIPMVKRWEMDTPLFEIVEKIPDEDVLLEDRIDHLLDTQDD